MLYDATLDHAKPDCLYWTDLRYARQCSKHAVLLCYTMVYSILLHSQLECTMLYRAAESNFLWYAALFYIILIRSISQLL